MKRTQDKIESGSNRDKKGKTKAQNKWVNPFYTTGTRRKIAFIKKLKRAQKLIQRQREKQMKKQIVNEMPCHKQEIKRNEKNR